MAYFSQSLSGAALEWYTHQNHSRWYTWDDLSQAYTRHFQYNIEIVPDHLSLTKIEKKPSESFREYGFRCREQAARVNPSIEENKMVYFLQALEPTYFGHLISVIDKSFNEVVKMGSMVEEGLKSRKIMSYSSIKATTQAIQNGTRGVIGKKKKEDVATSSEVKPVKKPTVEASVNKLSMTNGEPYMVVEKRSPSDVVAKKEKSKVVVPGLANKPIIIVEGVGTDPVIIKPVTQLSVINTKVIPWNYEPVIVTYKGKEVKEEVNETQGLTSLGRCFALEELRKAKTSRDNPVVVTKAVTEEEAGEFLRKTKVQDYSIVEQLRKTPAQISLLSLLIHSNGHRRALMKILNEAHVPNKITVNHLEKIANKIFEVNRITFSDDELPVEGTEHNKALYLTVKCENFMVTRVLIDNGSSANICPLFTLNKLKVDDERIHKNNICVRGFDGGGKDSVGDIVIELTIGLMVKFEWDRQEIIVHGEENLCAHSGAFVPFIEAEDDKGPWVYQVFKTVSIEKVLEGKCIPTPKIASASVMVATKMLRNGFLPDLKRAKRLKQKAWALSKPILCLSRSFVKPGARKRSVTTVLSSVIDIDKELIEKFQRLFNDVNMVEVGEGSSKADVQFVGPNVKYNNWKATPLPT
ncbi:uncharacterized protein [Nicotiana sylvestris]|uniref:uncharacterized protein n=1 Tax=Nicotiana sylvestris TaxID=4096 RepID=UPI00388CA469